MIIISKSKAVKCKVALCLYAAMTTGSTLAMLGEIIIPTPSNIKQKCEVLGDGIGAITLMRVSGSDLEIVNAARVSYYKESHDLSDGDAKLIKFLMEHNHTSPFEHNQLSFRVKAPLFVARQWFRHRMNSYNEVSQRYVEVPNEFYIPPHWRSQDKKNKQASAESFDNEELTTQLTEAYTKCAETYETLLKNGVSRELARIILPTATYTEFIFTCNLHSLMHFLKLRVDAGAQYEIRQYAEKMFQLALPHFPIALTAWKNHHGKDLNLTEDTFTSNFESTAL